MAIGDAAYIKSINRRLIISKIIEAGMISRADLSKITKLTRATISVQVADLLEEELIVESHQEHSSVGRKPIMLSINRNAGYALGVDLDHKHVTFTLSDLGGNPVSTDILELKNSNYDEILNLLIAQIKQYNDQYSDSRFGIVGVVIGIHGTVSKDEIINFIPQHKWKDKNLKADLEKELDMQVYIENNANLCSFAERVFKHHHSENLVSISMYSGIGLGVLINGELLKGYHGYAGEMGHMIIVPDGRPCNCGNSGCWELYASEASILNQLKELHANQHLTYQDAHKLIMNQDQQTCDVLDSFIKYVAIGLNNIINLLNPETIVLNSELLKIYPNVINKIESNLTSSISDYHKILISDLGKHAAVMGACALAIKSFLNVPDIRLTIEDHE
ncbi:ROK family transcriptional regulator [Metabacillus halosaccharovorans]|uniref:ROK family protein n=1 Tax=Metabacillus halosaccharovorans TaxID=930124 RepID=A0ABT3DN85_9BACI|nr:ROK family protein [Metabacillus halosaccharovorans]MCV9888524.1 ROK family protein [Metabacillus halosaccharovorans]